MMTGLPLQQRDWFAVEDCGNGLHRIHEPAVDPLLRANIWHLRGRDRDLIVDTGLGIASLREHLPDLFTRNPIVVLTHGHPDHIGGAHEFDECWAHRGDDFTGGHSLHGPELYADLGVDPDLFGDTVPEWMINARPFTSFDVATHRVPPATISRWLRQGDDIDLGDRTFTVLHLPGHSASSIGLFEQATGTLFSGDVIYDDILIDTCHGADRDDYRKTMLRLRDLPITRVHPGHDQSFDTATHLRIINTYLTEKSIR